MKCRDLRRRWPRAVVAATVLALLLTTAHAQTPTRASAIPAPTVAPSAYELRVVTHNIAGGPTFKGSLDALDGVNAQIESYGPDVVMMSEVCGNQVKAFREQHPQWHVHYSEMVSNQYSCTENGGASTSQGQVLASPYPIADVSADDLGHPDNRPYADGEERWLYFTLLCGDIAIPEHSDDGLRACVTHLRGGRQDVDVAARTAHTAAIRSLLHDRIWARGQAVTVGGDLNAWPNWDSLDNLYRLTKDGRYAGPGDFYEADQTDQNFFGLRADPVICGLSACRTGQYTTSSTKIDYAFISRNVTHGGRVSGARTSPHGSDHYLYRALFEIQY